VGFTAIATAGTAALVTVIVTTAALVVSATEVAVAETTAGVGDVAGAV
jgi:hypothetical protein